MPVWNNFYRIIVLVAVITLLFASVPANNLWWREAINSGHTLLFVFLSFVIYHQIRARTRYSNVLIIYFYVLIIGLLLGLMPLLQLSWHYIERNNAFPVIADFDANWATSFIRFNDTEILQLSGSKQKKNNNMHLVRFNQGDYPGVSVIEPEPDWSNYRKLRLKVYSMNKHSSKLVLRVHDNSHNQNHSDRFNAELLVPPGFNEFDIALSQLQHGPTNRELDLTHISGVILFSARLEEPMQLAVSNIYLE